MKYVQVRKFKVYLGDSVYASFDGYHIWLTTENGFGPSNQIALEPGMIDRLREYATELERLVETDAADATS